MMKRLTITALVVLLVSGCSTYSLEELRHATPKGSAFQSELAKKYMDFADSEEKEYDWQDSWYFADKGLMAVYGKDVAPEDLGDWNLPADKLAYIEKARVDLIAALTPEILEKKPEIAASAQFNFDCWVEQQEENWQQDDIEACRDGFARALAKLVLSDEKKSKKPLSKTSKKAHKQANKKIENKIIAPTAPTTTFFMVVFEPNKVVFTQAADLVLSDIAKTLVTKGDNGYEVVITDKTENNKDSLELSLERVQAVKNRLVESGVKASAIKNGIVKEKQINHRIEVFLNE
jgi:OOP family OmpA-OmpF porin